jgi:CubicO group peptidase (beta-lactamase class C family)
MTAVADLSAIVLDVESRWPSAGLAIGVIRDGGPAGFEGRGVADCLTRTPITATTAFRIGSITKTFTAIAVLQLCERGLVDLDAPANDYLRSFRLVPAKAAFAPATVRHLLTHTAGIGYWPRLTSLLRPGVGSGVQARRSGRSVADRYRHGLPVEVEPGTKWVYSNHGFAALGQLVEDVSGQPLRLYLRRHVFEPLGMMRTDLVRSERVHRYLATGYVLRSHGLRSVPERDVPATGAGAAYSTVADLTRYVTALLHHGANEHGAVLSPSTVTTMFEPHFRPDPRVPGMGLGFLLGAEDGHRTVGHDGIVAGFLSQLIMAPDDGVGVVVLGNTGGLDGRGAPDPLGSALLRRLLDLPADPMRTDLPQRPERWGEICGWYSPDPGPATNLFTRLFMGAGAEVTVRRGRLLLRPLTPVPALRRGMVLHPADRDDPFVFTVDVSGLGKGAQPVVFRGFDQGSGTPTLLMNGMAFRKRPDLRNPRPWLAGAVSAGAVVMAVGHRIHRRPGPG